MLVTGGYGGIGSRLCEPFARVGAPMAVVGRDAARAQEVARRIDGPTFLRTRRVASLLADENSRAGLERRIRLGRIAEVDDVVGPILMLASDARLFVTGHAPTVDGGLTAWP